MPRKPSGPRLYLRKDGERRAWIIRHNGRDTRTGFDESQRLHAEQALSNYIANHGGPRPTLPIGSGFIYFITCVSSHHYPVKIGWSATPPSGRLNLLQIGNPNLLTVAASLIGSREDERRLHLYFSHLHIRGEWFARGDDLIEYMGGLEGHNEVYGAEEFRTFSALE